MADGEKTCIGPSTLAKRSSSHDIHDAEKQSVPGETEQLKRTLKNRHIQMIAIGQLNSEFTPLISSL
jgi:amino acid permease